jgi:two-component system response regulator AtoC
VARAVLLVLADSSRATSLARALAPGAMTARVVTSISAAVATLERDDCDVVVLDESLEPATPLAARIAKFAPIPVVVTGAGGARAAVDAIRVKAADYVESPFTDEEMLHALETALGAAGEGDAIEPPSVPDSGLIGDSTSMVQVLDVVRRVAPGNATVLVRGESGTGKELIARALHAESPRAAEPFVKVHCAGIPESLLESELFGYERGAFTGAASRKPGRVELADGGTLFLDEIGDVTLAVQVKLLRLLQDREYERLGGTETLRANVRFVAATHRDLEHMIRKGEFREDLFYRLNVVPIWLPPLRARRDDVALLARHFCETFARAHDKPGLALTDDAIQALRAERWPGNVRQLHNFVERLVVLCEKKTIDGSDVRRELAPPADFATQHTRASLSAAEPPADASSSVVVPLESALRDAERAAIERALRHAKGNRVLAARLLGVGRATLYKKLAELGIKQ